MDAGFSGTSAASAIIAGVALVVQGAVEAKLGFRLSPESMRDILQAEPNSTPSKDPAKDLIGRMPDLRAIFKSPDFTLAPDVYFRDFVGDTGDPHTGPISNSPDIIVRAAAAADPQAAFGEASGTENDSGLSDTVQAGNDHHIYVRLRNRGADVAGVQAVVYWAPSSTLVTPDAWTLIGSVTIPTVPSGDVLTVSNEILWRAAKIPATGHYCFVALVGVTGDPLPTTSDFGDMDAFQRFVRERNNVTWRNFNVVSGAANQTSPYGPAFDLPFDITGPPDQPRPMQLEIVSRLPDGARAWIEMPTWMAPAHRLGGPGVRIDRDAGLVGVPVHPSGRTRLGEYLLPERARIPVKLVVSIDDDRRRHDHEISLRQSWHGIEVGRVTWRIARLEEQDGHR
jgi:hypothetical protein